MNSQVLIDRELLQELASFCSDSRSYNEAMRVLNATPAPIPDHLPDATKMAAPIPDAGERPEVVGYLPVKTFCDDGEELMTVAQHNRIVSALQASAMVVPDGWKLVELDTLSRWESELDQIAGAGHISDELIRMLAASPAPGDSQ